MSKNFPMNSASLSVSTCAALNWLLGDYFNADKSLVYPVSSMRKPLAVVVATISMIKVAAKTLKRILPAFNGVSN